jgi:hypothetical protein
MSLLTRAWNHLFGKTEERAWTRVDTRTGKSVRVTDTPEGKLFETVGLQDTCPDCGSKGFYVGPSGGMSTNIFCVNRACRSGFNITYFDQSNGTVDRIGQGDINRYPKVA